jgi:hypothetical protein
MPHLHTLHTPNTDLFPVQTTFPTLRPHQNPVTPILTAMSPFVISPTKIPALSKDLVLPAQFSQPPSQGKVSLLWERFVH